MKIVLAFVTPEQPVEPIQEVRWLKLLTDIDSGNSKDAVKKLWNDNKMILDVIIPKALLQDTKHESAPITVREYLIEKVASLDA
jgi:hypothetical protein